MCATPTMGGRSVAAAGTPARAETAAARASRPIRPLIASSEPGHDPLGVPDGLGESGDGIVLVLLVLEAGQVRIADVEQGAEDRLEVEHPAAALDRLSVRRRAVDVLQVAVVEALAALADGLRGIDLRARGVAHVDAEADALLVRRHGRQHVVGRGNLLVLRAVVVDGDLDVDLLDHGVEDLHRLRLRAADDGGHADVARVFEGAADVGGVVLHPHVADAEGRDARGVDLRARRLALLGGAVERQVEVVDGDVGQADAVDGRHGRVHGHLAEGVGGDPRLQPAPAVARRRRDRIRRPFRPQPRDGQRCDHRRSLDQLAPLHALTSASDEAITVESACPERAVSSRAMDSTSLLAPGAKMEKVVGDLGFGEGPAWHPDGYLVFEDVPTNRTLKLDANDKVSVYRADTAAANGLAFDRDRLLVACEGNGGAGGRPAGRIEKDGRRTVLADRYQGKRLNSPNDLAIDGKGHIYFTVPRYSKRENLELDKEGVYRIDPDGTLTRFG